MGLDLLEFTMCVEEAFSYRFPDEDMIDLKTPRLLIDYLTARLVPAAAHVCRSQRTFYRLRQAVAARVGVPRPALRPDTSLLAVISPNDRETVWEAVRQDFGAGSSLRWPRLADPGWLDPFRGPRVDTLRKATRLIAANLPGVVKARATGWTRDEIAAVVHPLICERFGLRRDQYNEDSDWETDMGVYRIGCALARTTRRAYLAAQAREKNVGTAS